MCEEALKVAGDGHTGGETQAFPLGILPGGHAGGLLLTQKLSTRCVSGGQIELSGNTQEVPSLMVPGGPSKILGIDPSVAKKGKENHSQQRGWPLASETGIMSPSWISW